MNKVVGHRAVHGNDRARSNPTNVFRAIVCIVVQYTDETGPKITQTHKKKKRSRLFFGGASHRVQNTDSNNKKQREKSDSYVRTRNPGTVKN